MLVSLPAKAQALAIEEPTTGYGADVNNPHNQRCGNQNRWLPMVLVQPGSECKHEAPLDFPATVGSMLQSSCAAGFFYKVQAPAASPLHLLLAIRPPAG